MSEAYSPRRHALHGLKAKPKLAGESAFGAVGADGRTPPHRINSQLVRQSPSSPVCAVWSGR